MSGDRIDGFKAIIALALGIIAGFWLWLTPLIGLPVTVVGLLVGILALKSSWRYMALSAIALNGVALFLSCLNLYLESLIS